MKTVILCGGQGTRIRDVSEVLPKPMLPVGEKPILWHIMKIYAGYGFHDFVLCLGYKGWTIKEFFLNFHAKTSDISLTLGQPNDLTYHHQLEESDWRVTMVDTGEETLTGSRIWGARAYLNDSDIFAVTYGDGVADIDIKALVTAHRKSGCLATITGVQPLGRFGEIELGENSRISEFNEKPNVSTGMINGGFMVFDKKVLDKYFDGTKNQSLEKDIIPQIVKDGQAGIYSHKGAWQCIDTPREYHYLNEIWESGNAFWSR